MKTALKATMVASVAALSLGLAGCDSAAENEMEDKAEAMEDAADAEIESMEDAVDEEVEAMEEAADEMDAEPS